MNAIAALGQRVIERVRGIGVATQMLLQILFSMPTLLGVKLFLYQMYRVGVMSLLILLRFQDYLLVWYWAYKATPFWSISVQKPC